MVRRPIAEEVRAGLCLVVSAGRCYECGAGVVQEDGFGLEHLIATRKAEQCGERVAGGQERDDEDGEDGLAKLELWVLRIQAGEDQISGAQCQCLLLPAPLQRERRATYPPKIIHDAARAMRRQYHGAGRSRSCSRLCRLMYRFDSERNGIGAVATVSGVVSDVGLEVDAELCELSREVEAAGFSFSARRQRSRGSPHAAQSRRI